MKYGHLTYCFTRICMCIWISHVYIVSCICQMNVHIRYTWYRRKDSSQMHVYIAYAIYYIRFKISTNTAVSGGCFNALSWVAAAQLPEHQRSGCKGPSLVCTGSRRAFLLQSCWKGCKRRLTLCKVPRFFLGIFCWRWEDDLAGTAGTPGTWNMPM